MLIRDFIATKLLVSEGGYSDNPNDNGNWFSPIAYQAGATQKKGVGKLVGSNRGVTGAALAKYLKTANITADMMRSLTKEQAIDICVQQYYTDNGISFLDWNRVSAALLDQVWLSGAYKSICLFQLMVGAHPDGKISNGGETVIKFQSALIVSTEARLADVFADARNAYFNGIVRASPSQQQFIHGWHNRANSFRPNSDFWRGW